MSNLNSATDMTIDAKTLSHLSPWLEQLQPASLKAFAAALESMPLQADESLFQQGDEVDALYIVMDGQLEAASASTDEESPMLFSIHRGEPVGEFQILEGGTRGATVRAVIPTTLARCRRPAFQQLAEQFDDLMAFTRNYSRHRIRRMLLREVLPLLLDPLDEEVLAQIEYHGSWQHLASGEMLCRKGDVSDSMSILVSGRLRVGDPAHVLREIKPGETVGELGLLTGGESRSANVYAVRDTEVVTLPRAEFDRIGDAHPVLLKAIAKLLAQRLRKETVSSGQRQVHAKNITLIPLQADIDLTEFSRRLAQGLNLLGSTTCLQSNDLSSISGIEGAAQITPENPHNMRLLSWLEELEARHNVIIYQADHSASVWTQRCLRQADRVLLVSHSEASPGLSDIETALNALPSQQEQTARSLVLLHPNRDQLPSGTRHWLTPRLLNSHYHVCLDRDQDFERLARLITGNAIGLVLSGGGARTTAHLGVLRALREQGIPIDMIGGTSGGGQAAIAHGMNRTEDQVAADVRHVYMTIKPYNAFTLPVVSIISSRKQDEVANNMFGSSDMEDLWLPTYTVSCNISSGKTVVHTSGPISKAAAATVAIPVMMPPEVYGQHLLVDGGVLDNMPVNAMRNLGAEIIIGCDVSPQTYMNANYPSGRLPSGWRVLWHKLMPHLKPIPAPTIFDVIMRLVTLNDVKTRGAVSEQCDLLIKPPVEPFGMLEFTAIDKMIDLGYQQTLEELETVGEDNPLRAYRDKKN